MKKLFTFILAVILTATLFAQIPQKMTYQAVVRNGSGALVTSSPIGVRISVIQGTVTGDVVYSETQTTSTNANGLMSIVIGEETALDIDWSNGPYFIMTETDPTGGSNYTITGTSQLLSVPYALYAKKAENGFSGNYNDLSNQPTLFDGDYNSLSNLPTLFDGQYSNLSGLPTLFDGTWTSLLDKPTLFDGNYNSLSNLPTLFDGTFTSLGEKPTTLTGYGITDAMNTSHPANEISELVKQQWNTAYSFTTNFDVSSASVGSILLHNGTNWYAKQGENVFSLIDHNHNSSYSLLSHSHADAGPLSNGFMSITDKNKLDDFNTVGRTTGDILMFNGTMWVVKSNAFALPNHIHSDATTTVSGFMSGTDKTKLNAVDGSETKITGNPGITVKGNGTTATPYTITVTQHTVGETYGGGVIFYVYDNGQHGLIAANADVSINTNPNLCWSYPGPSPRTAGAFANGIRAGQTNTAAILAMQATMLPSNPMVYVLSAAYAAVNFSDVDANGVRYGDWYIPSQFEMVLMSSSTATITGFSKSNPYWSSTEVIDNINYAYMVVNGSLSVQDKRSGFRVRPIRAF